MQNPPVNAPNGAICCKLWPNLFWEWGPRKRAVEGPGGTAAVYRGVVFSGGHPGGGERGGTSEAAAMKRHFVHKLAGRGQLFEVGSRFPRARSPRRLTALPPPDAAPCRS